MDGESSSLDSAGGASTVESLWHDLAGSRLDDQLLEWAPDLFAFTDGVLDRSEAYRFVVSPPDGASWPPPEMPDWYVAIADASAGWRAWVDGAGAELPELVAEEWAVVRERPATTLDELATRRPWRICQALLTLHAIADEACAGTGLGSGSSRACETRRAAPRSVRCRGTSASGPPASTPSGTGSRRARSGRAARHRTGTS
jgi:hypothetical protein